MCSVLEVSLNEKHRPHARSHSEILGLRQEPELFKTKSRMHHTPLTGRNLLQCDEAILIDELMAYERVLVPPERMHQEVGRYMENLSTAERKAFMTLFKVTQGPGLEDHTGSHQSRVWHQRRNVNTAL
jgi:hypothetical protein